MLEIDIPGKGPVETEFVGRVGNALVFADSNSLPVVTGKDTRAGELTDAGLTYGQLNEVLNSTTNPRPPEVSE